MYKIKNLFLKVNFFFCITRLKSSDRQFECDFIPVNLTPGSWDGSVAPGDNGEDGSTVPGYDSGRVEMRVIVSYPKKSQANLSPFPSWVYQMYETQVRADFITQGSFRLQRGRYNFNKIFTDIRHCVVSLLGIKHYWILNFY